MISWQNGKRPTLIIFSPFDVQFREIANVVEGRSSRNRNIFCFLKIGCCRSLFSSFLQTVNRKYWFNRSCRWLDSNRAPVVLEAYRLRHWATKHCPLNILLLKEQKGTVYLMRLLQNSTTRTSYKFKKNNKTVSELKAYCWHTVWPVKYRKMSIKVAQKWLQLQNETFWHLYKNSIKCGQFGEIIVATVFKKLPKVQ